MAPNAKWLLTELRSKTAHSLVRALAKKSNNVGEGAEGRYAKHQPLPTSPLQDPRQVEPQEDVGHCLGKGGYGLGLGCSHEDGEERPGSSDSGEEKAAGLGPWSGCWLEKGS